jgi:hypothetical protein
MDVGWTSAGTLTLRLWMPHAYSMTPLHLKIGKSASEAKDKVESRLLLDVVVCKGPVVLQLLPGKNKALLVRGDSLLVLYLLLDVLNRIRSLHIQRNSLSR